MHYACRGDEEEEGKENFGFKPYRRPINPALYMAALEYELRKHK